MSNGIWKWFAGQADPWGEIVMWKDLFKPTIIAYIIACAIPGGIAGVYYLYSTYF